MPLSPPRRYLTLASPATAELEVKRSRFVCDIAPVASEDAARTVIEHVRAARRDARHHCTAFVLGPDGATQRSNDDGEPSGTAGAPMLDVLRGRGLTNVVAVVTRWFGGTLLGAGGLVRAYGDAVRAGLDAAGVRERVLAALFDVDVSHADAGRLESDLRARGVDVRDATYAERVTLHVAVPPDADLAALLAELTGGTVQAWPAGQAWSG